MGSSFRFIIKSLGGIILCKLLMFFGSRNSYLNCRVQVGKKACVLQRRDGCGDGLQNSCLCVGSHGVMAASLQLTRLLRLETGILKQQFVRHSYVCYLYLTKAFLRLIRLIFIKQCPVSHISICAQYVSI